MSRVPLRANIGVDAGHAAPRLVEHRPAQPVRGRRADRRPARADPRRPGRLRAAVAGQRARLARRFAGGRAASIREVGRPADRRQPRPGPAGHHASRPARAQAGPRRRPAHGRDGVADLRRRRGDPRDGRGRRPARSGCGRGRGSSRSAWSAPSPTTTWTARSPPPSGCSRRPHEDRRPRPVRGQRGVRLASCCPGRPAPARTRRRSTSTAARSPSATRSAAPAPG